MQRRAPVVEILSFEGCPNRDAARALVERVAAGLDVQAEIRAVDVPDRAAAERLRFLGSPTIRVGGRDVEPAAEGRTAYVLACRVYRTEHGAAGQPPEDWVREALLREVGKAA